MYTRTVILTDHEETEENHDDTGSLTSLTKQDFKVEYARVLMTTGAGQILYTPETQQKYTQRRVELLLTIFGHIMT